MMIDAKVAPKVGFVSPFGTTVCNVNHINAGRQALPIAGATQEHRLSAVACTPMFGPVLAQGPGETVRDDKVHDAFCVRTYQWASGYVEAIRALLTQPGEDPLEIILPAYLP